MSDLGLDMEDRLDICKEITEIWALLERHCCDEGELGPGHQVRIVIVMTGHHDLEHHGDDVWANLLTVCCPGSAIFPKKYSSFILIFAYKT